MAARASIPARNSALIAMIADELCPSVSYFVSCVQDTVVGFLMAGIDNVDIKRKTNDLIVDSSTLFFFSFSFTLFFFVNSLANTLFFSLLKVHFFLVSKKHDEKIPCVLEIPSKDHPYDPAHDSVLSRVKYLFSAESVSQR
ncbi:hypothetical protein YC2023_023891 [Brassica napus]